MNVKSFILGTANFFHEESNLQITNEKQELTDCSKFATEKQEHFFFGRHPVLSKAILM